MSEPIVNRNNCRTYPGRFNWLKGLVIVFCLVVPSLVLIPWDKLEGATDFPEFYAAARLLGVGKLEQAYDVTTLGTLENQSFPGLHGRTIEFFLFPAMCWILFPLAWFPYERAFVLWTVASCFSLIAGFFLLAKAFRLSPKACLWTATLIGVTGPCLESIRIGQLSPFLLLGLACITAGMVNGKPVLAVLGQSLLWLKPHILFPLLAFEFTSGRIRLALTTCIVGALGIGLASLLGKDPLGCYARTVAAAQTQPDYNLGLLPGPTLRGQLLMLHFDNHVVASLTVAAYLLLLAGCLVWGWVMRAKNDQPVFLLRCVIPLALCLSMHLHNYDLLLLVPGKMSCQRWFTGDSRTGRRADRILIVMLLVLFSLPIYLWIHYFFILRGGQVNPFFWAVLAFSLSQLPWRSPGRLPAKVE